MSTYKIPEELETVISKFELAKHQARRAILDEMVKVALQNGGDLMEVWVHAKLFQGEQQVNCEALEVLERTYCMVINPEGMKMVWAKGWGWLSEEKLSIYRWSA